MPEGHKNRIWKDDQSIPHQSWRLYLIASERLTNHFKSGFIWRACASWWNLLSNKGRSTMLSRQPQKRERPAPAGPEAR